MKQNTTRTYKTNFKYTDDEPDTFEIHVRCENCWHDYGVRVKKGTRVRDSHLKFLKCRRCDVVGMLFRVGWNGQGYTKLGYLK